MKYLLAVLILLVVHLCYARNLKIVNGDEVEPHSLPYTVALRTIINERSILCGATLIREDVILTAARCVNGSEEVELVLGAHNIDEDEPTQVVMTSSEIIVHEEYDQDLMLNDIALVFLSAAVELTDAIGLVPLPTEADANKSYEGQSALVAGWGRDNDTSPDYSPVLNKYDDEIIAFETCNFDYFNTLSESQICTTGTLGKGICFGDNGGPLIVDGVQVGIASFGNNFACSAHFPSVFTRITSFLSWISSKIN